MYNIIMMCLDMDIFIDPAGDLLYLNLWAATFH